MIHRKIKPIVAVTFSTALLVHCSGDDADVERGANAATADGGQQAIAATEWEPVIVEPDPPQLVDVPLPEDVRREPEKVDDVVLINDGAGLLNADFTDWQHGVPNHWHIRGRHEHHVVRNNEQGTGDAAAVQVGGNYTYLYVRQTVDISQSAAGRRVVFKGEVKGPPGSAKLTLHATYRNNKRFSSPDNAKSNEWETLEVSFQLPKDFEGGIVTAGFTHNAETEPRCYFRNPVFTVE